MLTKHKVAVIGQGPGVSEGDRTRLFQPFAQLSAKPTNGEKSIGQVFAIMKHMIDAHGGKGDDLDYSPSVTTVPMADKRSLQEGAPVCAPTKNS